MHSANCQYACPQIGASLLRRGPAGLLKAGLTAVALLLGQLAVPTAVAGSAALLLWNTPAHAQAGGNSNCENPPHDEPDNDGDECYVPPIIRRHFGDCSSDTNGGSQPGQFCGNPINLPTGNKLQVETDYQSAGPLPLKIVRTYNSLLNAAGSFGFNWSLGYGVRIQVLTATSVNYIAGNQRTLNFNFLAGRWTPDADVNARLNRLVDGLGATTGWVVLTGDDGTDNFDAAGRLVRRTNRAGLRLTLGYDSQGNLTGVTDSFGRQLQFSYDAFGRIAGLSDVAGRHYIYSYDANNNLASVAYPDGGIRQYRYENSSFPHALTAIIDENGDRYASWS